MVMRLIVSLLLPALFLLTVLAMYRKWIKSEHLFIGGAAVLIGVLTWTCPYWWIGA